MIIFTKHAMQRMRERRITRQAVFQILRNPAKVETSGNNVRVYIGSAGRKKIKVITFERSKRIVIITLYHL